MLGGPSSRRAVVALAAFALVVAACSGTESGESTTTETSGEETTTTGRERTTTTRAPRTTTTAPAETTSTSPSSSTTSQPGSSSSTSGSSGSGGSGSGSGGSGSGGSGSGGSGSGASIIGVVGCSNTGQAVNGYIDVSSEDNLVEGELGGGSAATWGNPEHNRYSLYWGLYDERRPSGGSEATWLQLCLRTGEHQGAFDSDEQGWVTHIVQQIHARDPGITIWISELNTYVEGHVCPATGPDGVAIAAAAADWAAASLSNVARGPTIGPLSPDLLGHDDCHPNTRGELALGEDLVAFFD